MIKEIQVPLFDLIMSITNTVDLISPALVDHHKQVAYIAYSIAEEMDLPFDQRNEVMLAGALHDIGGLSLEDRINVLSFETENPYQHAKKGYLLLKLYQPFTKIANIIKHHHSWWNGGKGNENITLGSQIVHLADRVAVSIDKEKDILSQVQDICERIEKQADRMFMPQLVKVFKDLALKEYFWLDTTSQYIVSVLKRKINLEHVKMNIDDLLILTKIFSHIIDFRSPFTANHSSGVAATSEALAKLLGFLKKSKR